jgi:tetratricopeptide (TPR) repeat protein
MRPRLLFPAAVILLLASFAIAQNPPEPVLVRPAGERIAPPPHNATPAELEQAADEMRAQKAFADALDYYRAALKKQRSAVLQNKIGITELQMVRYKDAKKDFEKATKLDRNYADAFNNLGVVYYITGAQKEANARKAGKSMPRSAVRDFNRAIREYKRALALRETAASFHSNLGTAYFACKEMDLARAEYVRAMELDPNVFEKKALTGVAAQMSSPEDRAQYAYLLAKMYASVGNFDRAITYLRRSMEDGYKGIDAVYKDPEFAGLRKDERFAVLMASRPPSIPQ